MKENLSVLLLILLFDFGISGLPSFTSIPKNVTVLEGQEVTLSCSVASLRDFKIAWVHEDSQSIISIGRKLYTHSKRLSLATDHKTSAITVSPVLAMDRGWYMCQINTSPMMFMHRYLQVLVPPRMEKWSGPEVEAREGSNIELVCKAKAYPTPVVTWRRTDAEPIFTENDEQIWVVEGEVLLIREIGRVQSATYTCHIDNEVTKPISRETQLIVTYPPMIWIERELQGVVLGEAVTLVCITDGNPTPTHAWKREGKILYPDHKYRLSEQIYGLFWQVVLTVENVTVEDLVQYSCVANNPIGQAEGTLQLYEIKDKILSYPPQVKKDTNKKSNKRNKNNKTRNFSKQDFEVFTELFEFDHQNFNDDKNFGNGKNVKNMKNDDNLQLNVTTLDKDSLGNRTYDFKTNLKLILILFSYLFFADSSCYLIV